MRRCYQPTRNINNCQNNRNASHSANPQNTQQATQQAIQQAIASQNRFLKKIKTQINN